ncbi:D-3-phosphoglycerate dehydrogenase 1, chloroplastic [Datura stramonium]|uniref:D-3-phosphoglycerate dehydrogenase 1, chloroplastic n=1 Tax=Datura stramonium TaxID=4076 RepID=A0ABS8WYI5_DATST|nr:D-3-phosphoglycerate dehydrogenase 1, chloroplastic [Datura stramonium]
MPLTPATNKILNDETFAKMKKGVRIVSVARGGVIDEDAGQEHLMQELWHRRHLMFSLCGATKDSKLVQHENVTATPHLGASTMEAQEGVAIEIAEAVVGALNGELAATAVNAPMVPAEVLSELKPFVALAEKLGRLAVQLVAGGSGVKSVKKVHSSSFRFTISSVESKICQCSFRLRRVEVEGRVKDGIPHLTKVGSFEVDVSLEGSIILCRQVDQPGMVGKVGNILSEENVNVSFMSVGRIAPRKHAIMAIGVDEQPTNESLKRIGEILLLRFVCKIGTLLEAEALKSLATFVLEELDMNTVSFTTKYQVTYILLADSSGSGTKDHMFQAGKA